MLRPATEADLDIMRSWRNQEPNRLASINSHEISPDEHKAWWDKTSVDPTRRVLIFEREDGPVGVVSFFDLELNAPRRSGAWGFYLDALRLEAQEEIMPTWMAVMRDAIRYAFDELALDDLHGEVLEHNTSVRTMNRLFRFTEGKGEPREVDDRTIVVLPIHLRREDRRS